MLVIGIPVLVAAAGAVLYLIVSNSKVAELGRLAFGAGLLAALLQAGSGALRLVH